MLQHCTERRSNLDPGVARVRDDRRANTIAWPYRQAALLLLLSGSKRKLRNRPRWRRRGCKPHVPTRGMPPDRAKTKAAGFGLACCECPPDEVSILLEVGLARRQDPQNSRRKPKIEVDLAKLSPRNVN